MLKIAGIQACSQADDFEQKWQGVANLDQLWEWFRSKPGGIDSIQGVVQTLGHREDVLVAELDIAAVRCFPGYFSTRGQRHRRVRPKARRGPSDR